MENKTNNLVYVHYLCCEFLLYGWHPIILEKCSHIRAFCAVFGSQNYRLNDLYYIDLHTWVWHEM